MFRVFKHYLPLVVILLATLDFALLLGAAELAWVVRARQIGMVVDPTISRILPLITFACSQQLAMVAVGVYATDSIQSLRLVTARLLIALLMGLVGLSLVYFWFPGQTLWRSNALYAVMIAFVLLLILRAALGQMTDRDAFKRRILVLGAGPRAARLKRLAEAKGAGFVVTCFVDMGEAQSAVPDATPRDEIENLPLFVRQMAVEEVVLALQERRNAIPVDDLLRVRTAGVHVNEITTFLERETGRVDLRSTSPSWLIFSDGFSSGRRVSSIAKRTFDIAASGALLLLTLPLIALTALLVRLDSKGPALYRQARVGLFGQEFDIVKLRSMRIDAEIAGEARWASTDDPRVTRVGRVIRRLRIDELPQVWTVLKGDMSFVGPRPERPGFVQSLTEQMPFYAERHMVKPGITGWAQINYPYGASLQDARAKLEYDLYYAKNYTPFLDLVILLQTMRVVLFPEGPR